MCMCKNGKIRHSVKRQQRMICATLPIEGKQRGGHPTCISAKHKVILAQFLLKMHHKGSVINTRQVIIAVTFSLQGTENCCL